MTASRPTAEWEPLWVVGVGDVAGETLEAVATTVRRAYPLDVRVHPDPLGTAELETDGGLPEPFDPMELAGYAARLADRRQVLAVTTVDIANPNGSWAFGTSEFGGSLAVISTSRLGPPDDAAFENRLRILARKHTGHLLGKEQCGTDSCPFTTAWTAADLDAADADPCASCRTELDELGLHTSETDAGNDTDPTQRRRGLATEDSTDEVTHTLVSSARFWGAIVIYLACLLLTAVTVVSILDWLPSVGVPTTDAGTWVLLVVNLLLAWVVYHIARSWLGGAVRLLREATGRTEAG